MNDSLYIYVMFSFFKNRYVIKDKIILPLQWVSLIRPAPAGCSGAI